MAMQVSVRYFNILAALTGCRQETVKIPDGSTSRELLVSLAATYPPEFARMLFQDQAPARLSAYLRAFLNGKLLKDAELDEPLSAGDELMLFPAIAGG